MGMLIQLRGKAREDYCYYLKLFEGKFHRMANASERTEAFFCARRGTMPSWVFA